MIFLVEIKDLFYLILEFFGRIDDIGQITAYRPLKSTSLGAHDTFVKKGTVKFRAAVF